MMIKEPSWATHKIEWGRMLAFYNNERFVGYWEKGGTEMWSGRWVHASHKDEWVTNLRKNVRVVITDLLEIQENE